MDNVIVTESVWSIITGTGTLEFVEYVREQDAAVDAKAEEVAVT